jgi:hypothetical protein
MGVIGNLTGGNKMDSMLIKEKIPRKTLKLVLSEGDDVLKCIKQGMSENGVRECRVEDVSGKLSQGVVNCMEGSSYKRIEFTDKGIMRASGVFKITADDLWGNLHVFTEGRKPYSGTLHSGKAAEGFELVLSFVP